MNLFLMFYKTSKAHMWTWQADQMYSRGSCKNPTFWVGVSARAADGDETPPLPGFATASHIKGVTITASQEGEYMYPQQQEQRNGSDGWTRTSNGRINGAVLYHWTTSELVAGVGFEPTFFRLWAGRWYHSSQSRSFTRDNCKAMPGLATASQITTSA